MAEPHDVRITGSPLLRGRRTPSGPDPRASTVAASGRRAGHVGRASPARALARGALLSQQILVGASSHQASTGNELSRQTGDLGYERCGVAPSTERFPIRPETSIRQNAMKEVFIEKMKHARNTLLL